jgi:hypothetical protein
MTTPKESRPRRRLADLAWAAPLAVLLQALVTLVVVGLGPEPRVADAGGEIFEAHLFSTLHEPRDRVALVAWLLAAAAVVALVVWAVPRIPRGPVRVGAESVAAVAAVGVAVAAVLWAAPPAAGLEPWTPRLHVWELVAGTVVVVATVGILLAGPAWLRWAGSAVLVLVSLVFLAPALVQTPTSIVEPYHAAYTLDELMAPAVGQLPLVGYFPQYVNLLGYPVAPLLRTWPGDALAITLGWVLLLQVLCLAGAVLVGAIAGGRRVVPVVLLVVTAPVVFATAGGYYPASYLAAVPLRTVLPVLTIVVTLLLLARRPVVGTAALVRRTAVVGALAGTAALNNPDHGFAVVAAAGGAILLLLPTWRERGLAAAAGLVGAVLPFVAYALATALAGGAEWSRLLLFSQMFGTIGYGNVAMDAFGNHVGIVAFFAAATAVGALLVVRRRDDPAWRTRGLALLLCGGWSLLTLPYYMGRSMPSQLLFGYAVQVGLVSAALVPVVLHVATGLRSRTVRPTPAVGGSLVLALLALGTVVGSLGGAPTPTASLDRVQAGAGVQPWAYDLGAVEAALADPANTDVRELDEQGRLGQVLSSPSLVELTTGVPSVLVTNHPGYLAIALDMLRLQCEAALRRDEAAVIMPTWVAVGLASVEECGGAFEVADTYREVAPGLALVPVVGND